MTGPHREPPSVKSASRILDILELLATNAAPLRASEIAKRLGVPKSSAHMLLATLERRGYVVDRSDRRFTLHPALGAPGGTWVGGFRGSLLRVARPVMQRLVASTGESSLLGCLRADFAFEYVEKVVTPQPLRVDVDLGIPRPLHSTSTGQIFLAFSPPDLMHRLLDKLGTELSASERSTLLTNVAQVRARGYAMVSDAKSSYAFGVAAPIRDGRGDIVAALNVFAPSARFHPASDKVIREVVLAAAEITQELASYGIASERTSAAQVVEDA